MGHGQTSFPVLRFNGQENHAFQLARELWIGEIGLIATAGRTAALKHTRWHSLGKIAQFRVTISTVFSPVPGVF